jgi:hypothetical protein
MKFRHTSRRRRIPLHDSRHRHRPLLARARHPPHGIAAGGRPRSVSW